MIDKKKLRRQRGQSLVELLVTVFVFFTIVFMNVQVSFGFAVANYVQYVTFMASRALLSGAKSKAEQVEAGQRVFALMLKREDKERYGAFIKGTGDGDPAGTFVGTMPEASQALRKEKAREWGWYQGASYKFRMKMYMLPLVSAAKRGKDNEIELTSESWLGRDPSDEECVEVIKQRQVLYNGGHGGEFIYDNGC